MSKEKSYEPYGPEWEKEMNRMNKSDLIDLLKDELLKSKAGLLDACKKALKAIHDIHNVFGAPGDYGYGTKKGDKMSKENKEVSAPLEVIENQLLTALDDKSKVAILATREDLDLFISALQHALIGRRELRLKLLAGLKQLRDAAFEKQDSKNKQEKVKNRRGKMRVEGNYEITPIRCDNCDEWFEYKHHKSRPHDPPPHCCCISCHNEYIKKHPNSRFA